MSSEAMICVCVFSPYFTWGISSSHLIVVVIVMVVMVLVNAKLRQKKQSGLWEAEEPVGCSCSR